MCRCSTVRRSGAVKDCCRTRILSLYRYFVCGHCGYHKAAQGQYHSQTAAPKLPRDQLVKIYSLLTSKFPNDNQIPDEFTDKYFRLDVEGKTPDYDVLFRHFMFSRDMFEKYFSEDRQTEFKRLMSDNDTQKEGSSLLIETLKDACEKEDMPYYMAFHLMFEWIKVYFS
jgi:hypothetical protein